MPEQNNNSSGKLYGGANPRHNVKVKRERTLKSLRQNAGQDTSWKTALVDLIEEINRDNQNLQASVEELRSLTNCRCKQA